MYVKDRKAREQTLIAALKALPPGLSYVEQKNLLVSKGFKIGAHTLCRVRQLAGMSKSRKPQVRQNKSIIDMVTTVQAAKVAACSTVTVTTAINAGRLKIVGAVPARGGGMYVMKKSDVEQWATRLRRRSTTPEDRVARRLRKKISELKKELADVKIATTPPVLPPRVPA